LKNAMRKTEGERSLTHNLVRKEKKTYRPKEKNFMCFVKDSPKRPD